MDKKETLSQGRHDLEQKERDLKLKEDDAAWTNFIRYQKIAENSKKEHSEGTRATAILALGEYYEREGTQFPHQVHAFLKSVLDDFWDKSKVYKEYLKLLKGKDFVDKMYGKTMNTKNCPSYDAKNDPLIRVSHKLEEEKLPEYIKAIHKVINDKGKKIKNLFNRNDELCLNEFKLIGARLLDANLNQTIFCKANLIGAFLPEVMDGANFDGANLINAHLRFADLTDSLFCDANLTNADLQSVNFTDSVFDNVNLTNANLTNANLAGVCLSGANLTNVNFEDADLGRTCFGEADFIGVKYNNKTIFPTGFDPKKAGMINVDEAENKAKPKAKKKTKNR